MRDDARTVFKENLTYYMDQNGVSQQDLVSALNVSKSAVSDWVHGKNYPRIDVMQKLSDYLGVVMTKLTMPNDHCDEFTEAERRLVTAYRGAEDTAKQIALETLLNHQKQDTASGQTAS